MKILMFGTTGQVAREVLLLSPQVQALSRREVDFADPEAGYAAIMQADADVVINAAAYTAVDKAETEEGLAFRINAASPGRIADACGARNIPLLHLSTDYVFDGSGVLPWKPRDLPTPISTYGRSKLEGELAIQASGANAIILRTSWVFSVHGSNFVKTMLRLGAEKRSLRIVADQIGGPTPASAIASTLLRLAQRMTSGGVASSIHHFCGAPSTTWADFARTIFREAHLDCAVTDILSAEYPTPARRPLNSRLDCSSLSREFQIPQPDWSAGLSAVLGELYHA